VASRTGQAGSFAASQLPGGVWARSTAEDDIHQQSTATLPGARARRARAQNRTVSEVDLKTALIRLYHRDCPMAMPDLRDRSIDVGVRRWKSFEERHHRRPTREERVEDVARGLWQTFESRPAPGPELQEYRGVAEALADLLDPLPPGPVQFGPAPR
jgi:hypothetical protein